MGIITVECNGVLFHVEILLLDVWSSIFRTNLSFLTILLRFSNFSKIRSSKNISNILNSKKIVRESLNLEKKGRKNSDLEWNPKEMNFLSGSFSEINSNLSFRIRWRFLSFPRFCRGPFTKTFQLSFSLGDSWRASRSSLRRCKTLIAVSHCSTQENESRAESRADFW